VFLVEHSLSDLEGILSSQQIAAARLYRQDVKIYTLTQAEAGQDAMRYRSNHAKVRAQASLAASGL
jgi:hypothetical protein